MYDELVKRLKREADSPYNNNRNLLRKAADAIEELQRCLDGVCSDNDALCKRIDELQDALLLMVLQYCTTSDGLLYHSFMSAGENAFAVLCLENGQQADPLWDRVLIQKQPKEE